MFKIIILSQIGADGCQKLIFEILLLSPNGELCTDSYFVYMLKMEYVTKINIFGLKMIVKSGLEKIFLKPLHAQSLFWKIFFASKKGRFFQKITNSVTKINYLAHPLSFIILTSK